MYFPQLKVDGEVATGVEDKIRLLRKECFPQPPDADLADIETARYPQPLQDKGGVTPEEIGEAIWKLKPDKAPGTDVITNRVVKLAHNLIGVEWARLFSACLELGYHPRAFRTAITVVLRKPGKPDYSDPAAYRPIALLNTIGKVLEAIMARRISDLAEDANLLPDEQYGARPGRSAEDALLDLKEQVSAIWERMPRAVISILSLDVSKAFDRVSHRRLLHNLSKRKIPERIVTWVSSFLGERRTAFRLGDFTSKEEEI